MAASAMMMTNPKKEKNFTTLSSSFSSESGVACFFDTNSPMLPAHSENYPLPVYGRWINMLVPAGWVWTKHCNIFDLDTKYVSNYSSPIRRNIYGHAFATDFALRNDKGDDWEKGSEKMVGSCSRLEAVQKDVIARNFEPESK